MLEKSSYPLQLCSAATTMRFVDTAVRAVCIGMDGETVVIFECVLARKVLKNTMRTVAAQLIRFHCQRASKWISLQDAVAFVCMITLRGPVQGNLSYRALH